MYALHSHSAVSEFVNQTRHKTVWRTGCRRNGHKYSDSVRQQRHPAQGGTCVIEKEQPSVRDGLQVCHHQRGRRALPTDIRAYQTNLGIREGQKIIEVTTYDAGGLGDTPNTRMGNERRPARIEIFLCFAAQGNVRSRIVRCLSCSLRFSRSWVIALKDAASLPS